MPISCSAPSSAFTMKAIFQAPESDWQPSNRSFIAMAAESGQNPKWDEEQHFTSFWSESLANVFLPKCLARSGVPEYSPFACSSLLADIVRSTGTFYLCTPYTCCFD